MSKGTEEQVVTLAELQAAVMRLRGENDELTLHYRSAMDEYRRYRAVGAIAQQLRQSTEPSEIRNHTVTAILQLLDADQALFYRYEDKANGAAIAVAEAILPGRKSLLGLSMEPHLAQLMADIGQETDCLVIHDLRQPLPPALLALLNQHQVKSALIIPILREALLLGVVCVYQYGTARQWQGTEIESMQQLATEVAIALQQAELYQQAQQLNKEVEKSSAELKTALNFESLLKRITDKVRDSLDESQILQAAVEELTQGLELAGCNAALYDLTQGTSTISYEYIHSIPTKWRKVAQMDDFPEIYEQLKEGHYFQFCSLLPNLDRGRVAMLACPIFVDPQSAQVIDQPVLGDLWLIHHSDHTFNEFQIRLVQQVANQCAIAIRQARLFQAAQAQVQELEKLNRLKDEFLSTVSHELRTPIANVKMAIQMLKVSPTDDKRKQYLEILEKESAREAELINDLLDLQRLEADCYTVALEDIVLHEWLPGLVEPFQSRIASQRQHLHVRCSDDLPPFSTNAAILRRILAELLNNACKYTVLGGRIDLAFTYDQPTAETILTVANQAHIPDTELPKIFAKFYRCPNPDPWGQPGTGLGLALVQKLVEQLRGEITAQSINSWTTFTVRLPKLGD